MKSEAKIFTYQTRLHLTTIEETVFNDYAELMGKVERKLFAEITAEKNLNEIKTKFLKKFEITACSHTLSFFKGCERQSRSLIFL